MDQQLGDLVQTDDGSLSLKHREHGECYHSLLGAMAEARELYVVASGIEQRFAQHVDATAVLDVGLGLGYNAMATLAAWRVAAAPAAVEVVSLEIDEALVTALASGDAPWQSNWSDEQRQIAKSLRKVDEKIWQATVPHPTSRAKATWTVHIGDASLSGAPKPANGHYHYIWQDPFSPAKNPPLWTSAWFKTLHEHAGDQCILMTYSVARTVRDALTVSGWCVEKIPTQARRKKHWLRAKPAP